jgi:hypothetical protein
MEAPKGRYSVIEKDGRLIVIDNLTGSPAVSNMLSPRPGRPNASSAPVRPSSSAAPVSASAPRAPGRPPLSPSPIVAGKGMFDVAADALVTMASKGFDGDGRAIVAWEWKSNNKTRRWDARLDSAQQRRFGRALLAMFATPLPILAFVLLDGAAMWIALALSLPLMLWGFQSVARLQKETGGLSG